MTQFRLNKYIIIFTCLLLGACSGTKRLPEGEKLYGGAEIKLESSDRLSRKKKSEIKSAVKTALVPKPNSKFLGMRPRLCMYMAAGKDPKTKYRKWLQKTGEAPVLASTIKPGATSAIIDAKFFNIGIFRSYTEFKTVEKKRNEKILYISHVHKPYTVKSLTYLIQDESINKIVLSVRESTVIEPGDDYNLDKLKLELTRIDATMKDSGYFYFNPDYLLFKADTAEKDRTVTFKLFLKDSVPSNALRVYRINNV
ncbi:MAG: hypothetical protein H0X46_05995 [Bacteroidetes bacterium]|nr:hypothetical protein [Bacteroidota bacterium]